MPEICYFQQTSLLYIRTKKSDPLLKVMFPTVLPCTPVTPSLTQKLSTAQIGVNIHGACEAAVDSIRQYVMGHIESGQSHQNRLIAKFDLKNIFNTVHRDHVLRVPKNFLYSSNTTSWRLMRRANNSSNNMSSECVPNMHLPSPYWPILPTVPPLPFSHPDTRSTLLLASNKAIPLVPFSLQWQSVKWHDFRHPKSTYGTLTMPQWAEQPSLFSQTCANV